MNQIPLALPSEGSSAEWDAFLRIIIVFFVFGFTFSLFIGDFPRPGMARLLSVFFLRSCAVLGIILSLIVYAVWRSSAASESIAFLNRVTGTPFHQIIVCGTLLACLIGVAYFVFAIARRSLRLYKWFRFRRSEQ